MPIETPHATSYVLAIAVCPICYRLQAIESKIEMCLTLTFKMAMVKLKYASRKAKYDFLCVANSNVCPICCRLQYNHV